MIIGSQQMEIFTTPHELRKLADLVEEQSKGNAHLRTLTVAVLHGGAFARVELRIRIDQDRLKNDPEAVHFVPRESA